MEHSIPNNFHTFEPNWYRDIDFNQEADSFLNVLNQSQKENDIQQYIKNNQKWFIPASIFKEYNFGHHEAYLIPEQPLGEKYRVDYMLLGRNSIGYQIVLVEFENANIDYKIKTANIETDSVRKGLAQLNDWEQWLDDNRDYFLNSCGLAKICGNIPTWGIFYCLVVGRRNRMDDEANRMRGKYQYKMSNYRIMTYDRLVENIRKLWNGF